MMINDDLIAILQKYKPGTQVIIRTYDDQDIYAGPGRYTDIEDFTVRCGDWRNPHRVMIEINV